MFRNPKVIASLGLKMTLIHIKIQKNTESLIRLAFLLKLGLGL